MQLNIDATTIDMPVGSIGRGSRVRGGLIQYDLQVFPPQGAY